MDSKNNSAVPSPSGWHPLSITPLQQIESNEQGYRSTGNRPQFAVAAPTGRLPAGWVVVRYRGQAKSLPFSPRLIVDEGFGWDENHPVQLGRHQGGDVEELIRLPDSCKAIRLDPMEWDGAFTLENLQVRELGKIGVLNYLMRQYFHGRRAKEGVFAAVMQSVNMLLKLPRHGASWFKHELLCDYKKNLSADELFTTSLWFRTYRVKQSQLREMALRVWPSDAPQFSLVLALSNAPADWLQQTVESVQKQIYENWELICVPDTSTSAQVVQLMQELAREDARIVYAGDHTGGAAARTNGALKLASGDHVCFLEQSAYLEPHALFRFAELIVAENPDLIYADEVVTGSNDLNDIKAVIARPSFSYDYYLSYPYFSSLLCVRRSAVEALNGIDEIMEHAHGIDFNLRLLEHAAKVSHIPDLLHRVRQSEPGTIIDAGKYADATHAAVLSHLARLGFDANLAPGLLPGTRSVRFFPPTVERVAIIIPTKNRVDLLRVCVDSILATVEKGHADIIVVDHDSDDPQTQVYLAGLAKEHTVLGHTGPFNFSRINNCAVERIKGKYDYYLFMNNDIEAIEPGWFEAMLDLAKRNDVGIVGATLLYPNSTVQHAGVIFASHGAAEHAYKGAAFFIDGQRNPGHNHTLVATRDYSAVTAACMLMRASVFHEVGGYDEEQVVGFNDTDLCLRVAQRGYKILNSAQAILFHHESCTRGKSLTDPHPVDTARFIKKYENMIQSEDPHFSPLLSNNDPEPSARRNYYCPTVVKPRTVTDFLPKPGK